jgi:hypothetical protein
VGIATVAAIAAAGDAADEAGAAFALFTHDGEHEETENDGDGQQNAVGEHVGGLGEGGEHGFSGEGRLWCLPI